MKECRCPVCNSRMFDIDCGKVTIQKSSEDVYRHRIRIYRVCKCKTKLSIFFESTVSTTQGQLC